MLFLLQREGSGGPPLPECRDDPIEPPLPSLLGRPSGKGLGGKQGPGRQPYLLVSPRGAEGLADAALQDAGDALHAEALGRRDQEEGVLPAPRPPPSPAYPTPHSHPRLGLVSSLNHADPGAATLARSLSRALGLESKCKAWAKRQARMETCALGE